MMQINNIPALGTGLSYRSHFGPEVFRCEGSIDFLEIIADHYIEAPAEKMDELRLLRKSFTIIPHAINLSLGSVEGVDLYYLDKLASLVEMLDPPYWSEHISYTRAGGIEIGHLSPLPFTQASVDTLVRNIDIVSRRISKPLILENISYLVGLPGQEMDEGVFLTKLFSRADCGLLLDVTNLYYNSQNHRYDPEHFLTIIPLDRVVQLHFTGGMFEQGRFIDNHSSKTPPEVWALMEKILQRAKVKGVILERDDSQPDFGEILDDLGKAKELFCRHESGSV